jgi:hypothetical protein
VEKIGRNDACPCGSGKKYKKCCLEKGRENTSRLRDDAAVAKQALDWLGERYPDEVREAVFGGFLGELKKRDREMMGFLSPEIQELLNINIGEWLLTDAKLGAHGEERPVREILQGRDELPLSTEGLRWLTNLGEYPLSVYEIRSIERGEGMLLSDLLRPDDPDVRVRERKASQSLVRWDTIGARIVKKDNDWVLSGAVYPLPREVAASCRARIQRKSKGEDSRSESFRELCGSVIRGEWLRNVFSEHQHAEAGLTDVDVPQAPVFEDFEKWAEEALQTLGDRSPRKASKTPAGRRAVTELLKTYELHDARRIIKHGGEPFDLGFLWDGLGLRREGE